MPPSTESAIELKDITKRFGHVIANSDVNLKVRPGTIHGIVGENGAGKSTLMNKLAKSDVFAENKLFATVDTTVRKVVIRNLPFLLNLSPPFLYRTHEGYE